MRHAVVSATALLVTLPVYAALPNGTKAPEINTQATLAGNEFKFSLAEALKKGPVVLYFYPAGWHIRVPALALDLTVRPVLADQELQTTPRYWEGAVDVSGERGGASLGGRGYVELVGYAQER